MQTIPPASIDQILDDIDLPIALRKGLEAAPPNTQWLITYPIIASPKIIKAS